MSKSFKTYLNAELRRIAKRENLPEHKAFLFWFAVIVLELTEDDAREAISVEGANDKGADLFWVDDEEGRVIIAQGKHSPAFNFRAKVSHVTALESSLNWLANPEALRRDGKADLAQSAEDYIKATQDGYGVELWCVYTGPKCPNVEKHIGVYNQNPDNMAKRRAMRHYHVDMLRASWEELEGSARRITSDKVTTVGPVH